jgi:hypothetical protein
LEQVANVEHPSLAKLQVIKKNSFWIIWLRGYNVPDNTLLKINGAKDQPEQP